MSRDIIYTVSENIVGNPVLWLKADKGVTVDGNGKVSLWENQGTGGSTYDASQGTAGSRPSFVENVLNGKPALRFDGVDDTLLINLPTFTPSEQITIILLSKNNVFTNSPILGSDDIGVSYGTTIGNINSVFRFQTEVDSYIEDSTYYFANFEIASVVKIPSLATIYRNSIFRFSGTVSGDLKLKVIGARKTINAYYLNGDIAEIIIYNSALTDSQRIQVENYLKQKYNL